MSEDTYRCKSDYGEPDLLVRIVADHTHKTVDYYTSPESESMLLTQSARIFDGAALGYPPNTSLVTFTRWRANGQRQYEWERAVSSQVQETRMTKSLLESGNG
jgi:hypothetical protein